ncbi:MAG: DUF4942 domain-containing protein, partial [Candidatus Thiodiazotropha endolucinida]|nr:DUF4942 domain-containing protein [Candidatus Thiodiazotropha endolucinida]
EKDSHALTPPISDLDRLIERHDKAAQLVAEGLRLLTEAIQVCPGFGINKAIADVRWYGDNPARRYTPDVQMAIRRSTWNALLDTSCLPTVMSADDLEKLRKDIASTPPEITRENVVATFVDLYEQRFDSFRKGLVDLFRTLCRKYRSNEAFKIGKRVILDEALSGLSWNSYSSAQDRINDLFRILSLLDGKDPGQIPRAAQADELIISALRAGENTLDHEYFEVRMFQNGNLHIWFRRLAGC